MEISYFMLSTFIGGINTNLHIISTFIGGNFLFICSLCILTARLHSEMSSIFIYQYLITFQNSSFFFHFIFRLLRGCLRLSFYTFIEETLYYICLLNILSTLLSTFIEETLYYICLLNILSTYALYIPRGKHILHMLATARIQK